MIKLAALALAAFAVVFCAWCLVVFLAPFHPPHLPAVYP
jgi:hypothetical protein